MREKKPVSNCSKHQFTKEAGMAFDATGLLGGHRSQRYAAIIENGVVKQVRVTMIKASLQLTHPGQIFVEDEAPSITVTAADNVLKAV